MTRNLETRRVKEAVELQVTAVKMFAARLSARDTAGLESDFAELERAVADLRGVVESLPHVHHSGNGGKGIETGGGKDALEPQVSAVQASASRLSAQDTDSLDSDLFQLERAVAGLRGVFESMPETHLRESSPGAPAASPATTRPEREAKGAETADGTQRHRDKPNEF
ncbi:hypothetical protein [Geobacter sp. DSM 9736]|uniref:hypothetical protein n=1 Tax=Geobacter sp. DSM 9736 TaxID=1277350 RepID=UPI000B50F50C|nr:hypothetical protein [Geobacter sp. DSM 9736]SNB45341.1 hypothetical protein SAMN06269301_0749 [Geobacter sp. DSM 9736]